VISGSYPAYRIEVLDGDERVRYSQETKLSEGTIPLGKGALAPGPYKVRVYGLHDGQSEPVGKPQALVVMP